MTEDHETMGTFSSLTRRAFLQRAALSLPAFSALKSLSFAAEPPPQPGPAIAQLPPPPAAGRKKVIVVGAGMAGLTAAYELVNWGHDVTLLEAQNRVGGRVLTLRTPFADGLYAEAGAIDFTPSARNLRHYVKLFNLTTTTPRFFPQLKTPFHLRGQRYLDAEGLKTQWPYKLNAGEQGLELMEYFQKYIGHAADSLGDPTSADWDVQRFKHLDQLTLADYMKSQGASDEGVEFFSHMVNVGYGWRTGSALHRLASDFALFNRGGQRTLFLEGGTDVLPRAFARYLRDQILYGAALTRVVQENGKVRAVFRQAGSEQTIEGDYLICTAPCPAVKRVEFTPALPAAKRQIFDQLEYAPVTRIFLQTRKRFWIEAGETGNGVTDLPILLVAEQPVARPNDLGPRGILEAHIRGEDALPVGALDLDRQIAFAAEHMEKFHPGLGKHLEVGTAYSWHTDPWAGGGYPWWKPGQLTSWVPELAKPEGRVFFAGEHTSHLGRTLEGAVLSGNRAAREVQVAAGREG